MKIEREFWTTATTYTHLGLTFAIMVLLGFFGGYWLDGRLGTKPLFTLSGAFAGAVGGFIHLIRTLTRNPDKKTGKIDRG